MPSSPQSAGRTNSVQDRNAEAGYILLAVLFLVALMLLALAIAAPKMAQSIQRDRELELIHRGEQYKRAIKLYYRKYGAYPSSIDQLENTNQIRFLRKRYTDPMTGKDDWKIIHFGQAHVKTLGLFGQPIAAAGTSTAGSVVPGAMGPGGLASGVSGALGATGTGSGSITSSAPGSTDGSGSSGTSGSDSSGGSSAFGTPTGTSGLSSGGLGSGGLGSSGRARVRAGIRIRPSAAGRLSASPSRTRRHRSRNTSSRNTTTSGSSSTTLLRTRCRPEHCLAELRRM